MSEPSWFRREYERAKAFNGTIPEHARMVITGPLFYAHRPEPSQEEA